MNSAAMANSDKGRLAKDGIREWERKRRGKERESTNGKRSLGII